MAFSPEKKTPDVAAGHESLQDLARKLPEGDALPDGFSEGFTEESEHDNSAINVSKDFSNGPEDVITNEAESGALETLSDKTPESLQFSSGSPEVSVDSNDGSPCASPSGLKKVRRFPVQLSDKDSLDHLDEKLGSCTISGADGAANSEVTLTDKGVCNAQGADDGEGRIGTGEQLEFEIISSGKKETFSCKTVESTEPNSSKDTCFESEVKLHATLLEDELMDLRKQNKELENEKLSATNELAKNLLVRERLESLCRELQRQNKQLTDECKRIASEEQQKRLDLSTRFHDAIKDVTAKLEEQGDERLRHIKENELLQEKLKTFAQQYEFREQQYAQQLRTKTLEQQLLEVKLKQQEELNKQGEAKIELYTEQVTQLLKTEQDLRGRLALYGDKFEQFQDTLTKSNEVFTSFKTQMEKMSKTIKKLEKENLSLKKKCEKSDVSLIELVEERTNLKKQLETTKNQKEKLEALCRSLQAERKQQTLAMAGVAASAAATGAVSVAAVLKSEQEE